MDTSFEQQVRERAYAIWMSAGMEDGMAHDHWVAAEQAMITEISKKSPVKKAAAAKVAAPKKAKPAAKKTAPKASAKTVVAKAAKTKPASELRH